MNKIILLTAASIMIFIAAMVLVTIAIIKKSKRTFYIATLVFILSLSTATYTSYVILKKLHKTASDMFRLRTGEEIYVALFDKPKVNCVKIENYQDQTLPVFDCAIALKFRTCPMELKRILSEEKYITERTPSKFLDSEDSFIRGKWWKPKDLGDTVLVFTYIRPEGRRVQKAFVSIDSTRVYYIDILN